MTTTPLTDMLATLAPLLADSATAPVAQQVLQAVLPLWQHQAAEYQAVIDRYHTMVTRQTATVTRQTATIEHLTAAVEQLTASRNQLFTDGLDAYERGYHAFIDDTEDFLAEHYDQWDAYLATHEGLVIDPGALSAIEPRPPSTALRLCHACRQALGEA